MGQKANPKAVRLLINETWQSLWFGGNKFSDKLVSDIKARSFLDKRLKDASVSKIIINRDANKVTVNIHSGRPGVIIGRSGAGAEELKKLLSEFLGNRIQINIIEVKKPDTDAAIVARNVANQIERRIPFRRAIRQAIEKAEEAGVRGIKVVVSGRLNGADIARSEKASFGTVPLSTFKSSIDFKHIQAHTTYGVIGVKVWVYNGEKGMEEEIK